jgi:hypothetical protein
MLEVYKRMNKIIPYACFMLFVSVGLQAEFYAGTELHNWCTEVENIQTGRAGDLFAVGKLYGYIAGVAALSESECFTLPQGVTIGQLAAIVSRYLDKHPELWNKDAAGLVIWALMDTWPKVEKKVGKEKI